MAMKVPIRPVQITDTMSEKDLLEIKRHLPRQVRFVTVDDGKYHRIYPVEDIQYLTGINATLKFGEEK